MEKYRKSAKSLTGGEENWQTLGGGGALKNKKKGRKIYSEEDREEVETKKMKREDRKEAKEAMREKKEIDKQEN